MATLERCYTRLEARFEAAGAGLTGEDALASMGRSYNELLDNRPMLQMQLQMWSAACQDDDIRAATRRGLSRLWQQIERISGADQMRIMQFFASGMLLNVFAALELPRIREQLGEALTGLSTVPPG